MEADKGSSILGCRIFTIGVSVSILGVSEFYYWGVAISILGCRSFNITLRAETFAGIKFRVFRVFWSFSRKFLPLKNINHQNAKVFSREITNIFQTRKFFWQVTNSCSIFSRDYELYTEFAKVFSAKFVTNLSKRESFC